MKITIINFKGGVGKSLIAHQLITCFGFSGYELDRYGNLSERLPNKVKLLLNKLPAELPEDVVFDCGAFNTKLDQDIITLSDIVIIPFTTSFESVQTTLVTIKTIKPFLSNKKVLFVPNQNKKNSMLKEALESFQFILGSEFSVFELPDLQSFQTAVNVNSAITDLAAKNKNYQKAADIINEFYTTLKQV